MTYPSVMDNILCEVSSQIQLYSEKLRPYKIFGYTCNVILTLDTLG